MPNYDWLLFDLDGTLSDPAEGFVNSMNYALVAHDFAPLDANTLTPYIGPPLETTIASLADSDDQGLVRSMVDKYRERYADIGYAENRLYPGISETLAKLGQRDNIRLGVCTSKRADFAKRILEQFNLKHHFEFVSGGDVGIAKWQQLEGLLADNAISTRSLMIGDRHFDLSAAAKNQLPSAGVLWGYGSRAELNEYNPVHLFARPVEILDILAT
ncbi:HAD hydrolase-like protein [Microbulbifer aggregans]|uniref:HAD hydrolase-like protein n=1 Tax=Microbulbifer aggregans TaxID=1769779 RepID=UPI001CFD81A8|nr:HAD hydrolase-like protein [Microbulbifer aggregans]